MPVRVIHTNDLQGVVKNRKGLMQYNASLNKFELKDIKEVEEQLLAALDDNDLPDEFIDFVEQNLDIDDMEPVGIVDGGKF